MTDPDPHLEPVLQMRAGDRDTEFAGVALLISKIAEKRMSDLIDLNRGQVYREAESPLLLAADLAGWVSEIGPDLKVGAILEAAAEAAQKEPRCLKTRRRLARQLKRT